MQRGREESWVPTPSCHSKTKSSLFRKNRYFSPFPQGKCVPSNKGKVWLQPARKLITSLFSTTEYSRHTNATPGHIPIAPAEMSVCFLCNTLPFQTFIRNALCKIMVKLKFFPRKPIGKMSYTNMPCGKTSLPFQVPTKNNAQQEIGIQRDKCENRKVRSCNN